MKLHRYLLCLAIVTVPLSAFAFSLQWPLDCTYGKDCFVQNYADHDPTTAAHDFTCGFSTYDKHDGTDIRLRDLAAMRKGVVARAVADGTVMGARDGMADISIRDEDPAAVKDHECGNGMRIQHAEGYMTMMCHMQKGSIRVHAGQKVKAGDALGLVGLSGQTEFPHLHITVWKDGVKIDPFDNEPITQACHEHGAANLAQLWAIPLPYQPTALLGDGFSDALPRKEAMRDTPVNLGTAKVSIPQLTYWYDIMGVREGDHLSLSIRAPDGKVWMEKTQIIPRPMALYFGYSGKRNHGDLAPGTYRATLTLERGQVPLLRSQRALVVQ